MASENGYGRMPITGEVIAVTLTTTPALFAIPAAFAGMICELLVEGTDADILAGSASVAVVYGQCGSVASNVITVNAGSGMRLQDGLANRIALPAADRAGYFSAALKPGVVASAPLTIAIIAP